MTRYLSKWLVALVALSVVGMVPLAAACTWDGHTPGFWGNKNGQALIDASDLEKLQQLHLRDADGNLVIPADKSAFADWLRGGDATNMAYMLAVQLAAMRLNVWNGFVHGEVYVYAPGTLSADADGVALLEDLLIEAHLAIIDDGYTPPGDENRAYQEALKNAIDNANNNLNWVV